jgi:hypothetical protein
MKIADNFDFFPEKVFLFDFLSPIIKDSIAKSALNRYSNDIVSPVPRKIREILKKRLLGPFYRSCMGLKWI